VIRALLSLVIFFFAASSLEAAQPTLLRIKAATFVSHDLAAVERDYGQWLGYKVRERGKVDAQLARSWGAERSAGRPYILMSADGDPDVFVRVVEGPAPPKGLEPLTSWGWNGIEIVVDDPVALYEKFRASPFKVIGEPAPLGAFPTIVAFQVVGPSGEVLYLTAETGDRSKSVLPSPNGEVGRVFIMVLGGPDINALLDFYSSKFTLVRNNPRMMNVGVVRRAQRLADDEMTPLATARLAERGNLIEFDGYSPRTQARPKAPGELGPGIVSTTFTVADLDALALDWLSPPRRVEGLIYQGRRAASVRGPAGELIELVEAAPPAAP
jgi:hypothetical protein